MSQTIHPLLINHVVEKILESCAENDSFLLLRMRLVCQVWSQVGSLCHRKMSRSYIRIGQNFNKPPEFDEILSKSSHGSNFPLGNFELCPDVFQPKYEPFLEAFFCTSSSLMLTSLSIRLDVQSTLNFARTLDSLPQLPRLKNLSFEDRRSNTVAFDEIFRILVQASAQNLESLTIRRKPSHGAQAYGQELQDNHHEVTMMARICDTFGTIVLRNLKNLQMDLLMWDELLICLSNRLAPLFSLSLCLKSSNFEVKSGSLHALLQSQSQTLINLRLDGFCKKSQLRIDFPIFGRLQLLQIQGWCHNLPGVEYSAFSYAQNFPVLKELILDTWSFQPSWRQFLAWNSDQFNGGGSLSRIKLPQEMLELELISNDMPMTFSNLKSLTLHFQPALLLHSSLLLETVFENLETLEELRILGSFCEFDSPKCLDPLLTGLDAKECQRMIRVNNFFNVISDESNDNLDRRPSLACLKSLKFLDLSDVLKRQAVITDVTGYMLLSIKSLKRLKISQSKMRQNCFYQLCDKFPSDLVKDVKFYSKKIPEIQDESSFGSCQIM